MVSALSQNRGPFHAASTPRHQAARRGRTISRALAVTGALLVGAGATAGAYTWSLANSFDSGKKTIAEVFPSEASRPAPVQGEAAKSQNILLLGADSEGAVGDDLESIRGRRADSIMVVHVPADREAVQVVSIMRDSWVPIPGHGDAKINAALSLGGVPLMVQTVEQYIDVRIDRVSIVDFAGFAGLTDALGGVTIDNPIGFASYHIKGRFFEAGPQTLNGDEALAFVRERYAFSDGDYQRVRNQQLFIKAVLGRTLSAETLTNPVKVSSLVTSLAPYLTVDEGLNAQYVMDLALGLTRLRANDIAFITAPTNGTGTADGQSIVVVDEVKREQLRQAFRTDTLDEYAAS